MMVHSCNFLDLWHESLHGFTQSSTYSLDQFQTNQSFSHAKTFLGCSFHLHKRISKTFDGNESSHARRKNPKACVGLKVKCASRTADSPKSVLTASRKNRYGGILPSILKSLEYGEDFEKTLALCCQKLNEKEKTVILKEQRGWERVVRVFEWMKSQNDYLPNVIHFNVVLRALGMAQKWDQLRLYWIEMARMGVLPSNNTYGMLVDVYAKAGLVKESLMWIEHMKNRGIFPDEVTMNTVVRVLKDVGEYDRAEKFYKDWTNGLVELDSLRVDLMSDSDSGCGLDPLSFKHFLSTELFKTGVRAPHAKAVGSLEMQSFIQKPQRTATYNTLIDLYGKAGRLKDAADTFAEMLKLGVPMNVITFNTMIYTCGSHGRLSEAESLLSEMEERRITPDTKTFNIFLSLYADVGKIDAALECYHKIREVGLFPDIVTYRAVLQILCERNMVLEAGVVIEEMERDFVLVDKQSLPVIIKMYVSAGLLEQAKTFLEKRQSHPGLSSNTYAAIIDVYAEKGLWAEAEVVFLRKGGLDGYIKDVSEYNVMIKAYGNSRLYDKALSLFSSMKSRGTWPDACTYNSLIQMLSGSDLVVQARTLLAEMQGVGLKPQCQTFSSIIAGYVRIGEVSDAVNVYHEMLEAGIEPNEFVLGAIINGYAESGRVVEALKYFHVMEKCGIKPNRIVLTTMIKAYSKIRCLEEAEKLYEIIKCMEGGVDVVASNSMIKLYADFEMVTEAKSIFDHLREKGSANEVSFASMMYLYRSLGMVGDAVSIAEKMKLSGLLTNCSSFNSVLSCYAMDGQLSECGNLLHEMRSRNILPDGSTFKILFRILKKGGGAIEVASQLESSYQEGKPYAREAVFACVFAALGLHIHALDSCEAFSKSLSGLDLYAYNAAIFAYGASGEIDKALNVYMKMKDGGLEPDLVTLIHLVGCYGRGGMVEGVKRIDSQLRNGIIEHNESLFRAVRDAYDLANKPDLADLIDQEMRFIFNVQQEQQQCSESDTENDDDLV